MIFMRKQFQIVLFIFKKNMQFNKEYVLLLRNVDK